MYRQNSHSVVSAPAQTGTRLVMNDSNDPGLWHQMDWEFALQLRRLAVTVHDVPMYLLAPEVSALLWHMDALRELAFFSTLWNTGARPNEALALTPGDFELDGPQAFVTLRTLKQRRRSRGRPAKDEVVRRVIPLLDKNYVKLMRQMLVSFPMGRNRPLWPESHDTVERWLQRALVRAAESGVTFSLARITPKTFRHSFAMHLLYNRMLDREVQELMGHRRPESTQVYTKVFTLEIAATRRVSFSFDGEQAAEALKAMALSGPGGALPDRRG